MPTVAYRVLFPTHTEATVIYRTHRNEEVQHDEVHEEVLHVRLHRLVAHATHFLENDTVGLLHSVGYVRRIDTVAYRTLTTSIIDVDDFWPILFAAMSMAERQRSKIKDQKFEN